MSTSNLVKKYWPQYCREERHLESPPLVPLHPDEANAMIESEFESRENEIAQALYERISRMESALDWWLKAELKDVNSIEPCIVEWIKTAYHVNDEITRSALVKTWNLIHGN